MYRWAGVAYFNVWFCGYVFVTSLESKVWKANVVGKTLICVFASVFFFVTLAEWFVFFNGSRSKFQQNMGHDAMLHSHVFVGTSLKFSSLHSKIPKLDKHSKIQRPFWVFGAFLYSFLARPGREKEKAGRACWKPCDYNKGVRNDVFNFVSTCHPFSPFFYLQKDGLFQSKQGSFGFQVSPGLFFFLQSIKRVFGT